MSITIKGNNSKKSISLKSDSEQELYKLKLNCKKIYKPYGLNKDGKN